MTDFSYFGFNNTRDDKSLVICVDKELLAATDIGFELRELLSMAGSAPISNKRVFEPNARWIIWLSENGSVSAKMSKQFQNRHSTIVLCSKSKSRRDSSTKYFSTDKLHVSRVLYRQKIPAFNGRSIFIAESFSEKLYSSINPNWQNAKDILQELSGRKKANLAISTRLQDALPFKLINKILKKYSASSSPAHAEFENIVCRSEASHNQRVIIAASFCGIKINGRSAKNTDQQNDQRVSNALHELFET